MELGELIVGDQGIIGWVTEKNTASFKVIDHNGYNKTYSPPNVEIMGGAANGVLVVRNLLNLTGGATGASGLASTMMMVQAMGGGDDKMEKLLPLILMSGGLGGAAPAAGGAVANPMMSMLPFLLMKEGGLGGSGGSSMEKLLPLMMMGGMGGGAGGMNPLVMMSLLGDGDLFGGGAKTSGVTGSNRVNSISPTTRGGVPVLSQGSGF